MSVGVTFDFFGTLVEIDRDVRTIGEELTARGYSCSDAVEAIWNSTGFDGQETHDPFTQNYIEWRTDCLRNLATLCGATSSDASLLAKALLAADQCWTVRQRKHAAQLIAAADESSASYCLLTNWDYQILPYLNMAHLPDIAAVISADVGFRKPHPAIFERARHVLKVPASCHIHVGDDWTTDVVGAIRSGAWALWISETSNGPLPSRIVRASIGDAPSALRELIARVRLAS